MISISPQNTRFSQPISQPFRQPTVFFSGDTPPLTILESPSPETQKAKPKNIFQKTLAGLSLAAALTAGLHLAYILRYKLNNQYLPGIGHLQPISKDSNLHHANNGKLFLPWSPIQIRISFGDNQMEAVSFQYMSWTEIDPKELSCLRQELLAHPDLTEDDKKTLEAYNENNPQDNDKLGRLIQTYLVNPVMGDIIDEKIDALMTPESGKALDEQAFITQLQEQINPKLSSKGLRVLFKSFSMPRQQPITRQEGSKGI